MSKKRGQTADSRHAEQVQRRENLLNMSLLSGSADQRPTVLGSKKQPLKISFPKASANIVGQSRQAQPSKVKTSSKAKDREESKRRSIDRDN